MRYLCNKKKAHHDCPLKYPFQMNIKERGLSYPTSVTVNVNAAIFRVKVYPNKRWQISKF